MFSGIPSMWNSGKTISRLAVSSQIMPRDSIASRTATWFWLIFACFCSCSEDLFCCNARTNTMMGVHTLNHCLQALYYTP